MAVSKPMNHARRGAVELGFLKFGGLRYTNPSNTLQDIPKDAAADLARVATPAPENGASQPLREPPKPAKAREDGASTPESGEISKPEAPGDEVTGSGGAKALPQPPPTNGYPVAAGASPKRKLEADR